MTDNEASTFEAIAAILFYAYRGCPPPLVDPFNAEPIVYATAHAIHDGKLLAGQPLSHRHIDRMIRQMDDASALHTQPLEADAQGYMLPEELLYYREPANLLAWWRPAKPETLQFHKSTHIPSGTADLPPLLFCYRRGTLSVYALAEDRKPSWEATVCDTPFFNGSCMGTVQVPPRGTPAKCADIQRLFFDSQFTFVGEPSLNGDITGEQLWKGLVGKGTKFPMACLKPCGTLGLVLTRHLGTLP